jgi:4-hydroxy-3-methylbut-2-enyl diphosphate reductase
MKEAVADELAAAYHSGIVDDVRANDFQHRAGRLTVHLAREFGFCYGVDRAVDYAYQARRRFPDQTVYLTGEIIHNPHVNDRLRAAGIRFRRSAGRGPPTGDVVILPFSSPWETWRGWLARMHAYPRAGHAERGRTSR